MIVVNKKANSLYVSIKDNGKGFDLKQTRKGVGLANIRNRVEVFNGTLNIITSPGKGCNMEVSVPLKKRV